MIAHAHTSMNTLLTFTFLQMSNTLYIAACILISVLMQILNINSKTRYSNIWLKPRQYNQLHRYLKQWRIMLAHLNKRIDIYFSTNYAVTAYQFKTQFHSKQLTWKPYGYKKRRQACMARTKCLIRQQHNIGQFSMQSTTPTPHRVHFDSDSYDIFVDNCCSKSITNCLDDFLEPPRPSNLLIKGFNGATATTKVGTVQWPLQDDEGRVHKITLPHTYYSKHAEHRLLSPQHWAQIANQGRGTRCITYHDSILLIWGNGKYRKTVPLSPSNVGVMSTPPGMQSYLHICQKATCPLLSFPTTIHQQLPTVTDSEEEQPSDKDDAPSPMRHLVGQPTESTETLSPQGEPGTQREEQRHTRYNPTTLDEQQEYMRWHYKLNHASQKVMTRMANKGMLPSYITRILKTMDKQCRKGPICNDCYSASAARTPGRTKPNRQMKQTDDKRASLSPGDVVSVDQLETSTPGFIGQITGILTRQRHKMHYLS